MGLSRTVSEINGDLSRKSLYHISLEQPTKAAWWPWQAVRRPFDLESGVRVTCDVGYLCAKFSLPIGLSVLDLGPIYATDVRQTSDR